MTVSAPRLAFILWRPSGRRRSGAVTLLAAFMMIAMLGMVAFAVDMGRIVLVRTQLQAAADSAAMAAAASTVQSPDETVDLAKHFADLNAANGRDVRLRREDVATGRWDFASRRFSAGQSPANAIRVITRCSGQTGGEVPLLFGQILGLNSREVQAQAVAAVADNFSGFRLTGEDQNLPVLPIARDKESWDRLALGGEGGDGWTWDADQGRVEAGSDHVPEINLYPQDTGSAGNCGTVDIGHAGNSTKDIGRQIRDGVSAEDLEPLDGKLELGPDGTLELNGDPGISAGIMDDLRSIVGKPRIVPIFDRVAGSGNNAQYRIVRFAGVRVMEVELTGKNKRVVIQPAAVFVGGAIPAPESVQTSYGVYSRPHLVQ